MLGCTFRFSKCQEDKYKNHVNEEHPICKWGNSCWCDGKRFKNHEEYGQHQTDVEKKLQLQKEAKKRDNTCAILKCPLLNRTMKREEYVAHMQTNHANDCMDTCKQCGRLLVDRKHAQNHRRNKCK